MREMVGIKYPAETIMEEVSVIDIGDSGESCERHSQQLFVMMFGPIGFFLGLH